MNQQKLHFTKMQGAGNDFVVLDNRELKFSAEQIINLTPRLCNRRLGIGADGLLAVLPSNSADYTMLYRNADGSDAGMCGNGGRCVAAFARKLGLPAEHSFDMHGVMYKVEVFSDKEVELCFSIETQPEPIQVDGWNGYKIWTGTEHVVFFVDHKQLVNEAALNQTGNKIRNNAILFPKGTNVNFASENGKEIHLQTYERGVEALTLACGTGAIATAIASDFKKNHADDHSTNKSINCKGGVLEISFRYGKSSNKYDDIRLRGPVQFVYEGIWHEA